MRGRNRRPPRIHGLHIPRDRAPLRALQNPRPREPRLHHIQRSHHAPRVPLQPPQRADPQRDRGKAQVREHDLPLLSRVPADLQQKDREARADQVHVQGNRHQQGRKDMREDLEKALPDPVRRTS